MNKVVTCTVCTGSKATSFLRVENMPVSCNHLCASRDAATNQPRAVLSLAFCTDCGHIFNVDFDSARLIYREGYENSLSGSDRFREYDETVVVSLLDRYHLRGRRIVEIGCGRGEFLRTLCQRGGNVGVGFDPSYPKDKKQAWEVPEVVIRPEVYNAQSGSCAAQFICSRHTLEHVANPRRFLADIRDGTGSEGVPVFFEVPNALYTLRDEGIWDIIYEHCSYFTSGSLARLFLEAGYDQVEVAEAFSGQFLTVHARTGPSRRHTCCEATPGLGCLVGSFAMRYQRKTEEWASRLLSLERQGRKAVVWGAGAKAATFLNLLDPGAVEYVVDVNPLKHGKYVVGTGQRIVPPEFLRGYAADDIICMNPCYFGEIACRMSALGVEATLMSA